MFYYLPKHTFMKPTPQVHCVFWYTHHGRNWRHLVTLLQQSGTERDEFWCSLINFLLFVQSRVPAIAKVLAPLVRILILQWYRSKSFPTEIHGGLSSLCDNYPVKPTINISIHTYWTSQKAFPLLKMYFPLRTLHHCRIGVSILCPMCIFLCCIILHLLWPLIKP